MNYFNKLPSITYNGHTVKNLLARARLSDKTKDNKLAFYPYTLDGEVRTDTLSNDYYDHPGYTWLVWFANDVIDPYYDMPLSEDNFTNHLISKYGSVEAAMRKISFYRANWYFSEDVLTPEQFEVLPSSQKRYYNPVVQSDYQIHSYKRKQEDDVVKTNKILNLTLTGLTGQFKVGEEVRVNVNNYAAITYVSDTMIACQHVVGAFADTNVITGQESGATATIQSAVVVAETIASTDAAFWVPVTYFEYEQELNEKKKEILLLDVRYKGQAEAELKRLMSTR